MRHPGADPILPHDAAWSNGGGGSNNFVLAGARTASGFPLLANDPHLDLTLPSIWYEIQLQAGNVNAYGVSLPGLPGIEIGFTSNTAWGVTNGMDDVFDWVRMRFQDSSHQAYAWNGQWRRARFVLDTVPVRGGTSVVDTQLWTHLGPVPVKNNFASPDPNTHTLQALQWLALEPANNIRPFLKILSAQNDAEFRSAISGLHCPSQNFAFADSKNIALIHQGRFPIKRFGQGRTVVEGQDSTWEWKAFIPDSALPAARNPTQGWLGSSNQEPTDSTYPFYLGSQFYQPERAVRQHELLRQTRSATLDRAWRLMGDDYSAHAAQALPLLLRHVDNLDVTPQSRKALQLLRAWNDHYAANGVAPTLFDRWWKNFYHLVWADDFDGDSVHYAWPNRTVTRELLAKDSNATWFDDRRTPKHENAGDLARQAFLQSVNECLALGHGQLDSARWGKAQPISIPHLLRLPALGLYGLSADGCAECLNAQRGTHGPSWRMAVQLGPKPQAWGGYPGGQSGNPGSPAYTAFVPHWLQNQPYALLFLNHLGEDSDSIAFHLALQGTP